jgi:NADPH-dependent glutamate synthase beta subunit-like oxidoreductase
MTWCDKILSRCIGEEPPPCQAACPLDIPVREKLARFQAGDLDGALAQVLSRCPFPGILGRICSRPCEAACTRGRVDEPIAIAPLKRYLADRHPEAVLDVAAGPDRPERLAVVGGGPAGLMAALELRRLGYGVTLIEAENALGGALRWYVPAYRLPPEVIDRETAFLEQLRVDVRLNTRLGRDVLLEDLCRDYAAVFLALGASKSLKLHIPGEDLPGVLDGLGFLKAFKFGQNPVAGKRVAVIGGGNVAVDAARTARRGGSRVVTLICLESREEMPAFAAEVEEAEAEGVNILTGWGVKEIGGEGGRVDGLTLKAVARVIDAEGRFAPVYHEDRLNRHEADIVITAVGQRADLKSLGVPLVSAEGALVSDPESLATAIPGVFAGGDLTTGPRTAVEAFAAGRRAAVAMHHYVQGTPLPAILPPLASRATGLVVDTTGVTSAGRPEMPVLETPARLARPEAEVELGLTDAQAEREAGRCLTCVCSQCVNNCTFLQAYVEEHPATEKGLVRRLQTEGLTFPRLPYSCHYCGLCQAVCPQDLHAGEACLDFRRQLVAEGKGPLPQHRPIQSYVRWGTSPAFALSLPDPAAGRADRVFFPGCSLPGYSPHLVRGAYNWLRQNLPLTGIMLNCCGAPSHFLGEEKVFAEVLEGVATKLIRLGAREVIAACTHCLLIFQEFLPEFPARSLYEVMLEQGPPPAADGPATQVFQVQDACGARHMPQVQEAVRRLIREAGHQLEEMPHHRGRSICCGAGGMVPVVDAALARRMTDFRLAEASRDLLTYCASCRAMFARAGHRSAHVLELFFNREWQASLAAPAATSLTRWWRRWRLKRQVRR